MIGFLLLRRRFLLLFGLHLSRSRRSIRSKDGHQRFSLASSRPSRAHNENAVHPPWPPLPPSQANQDYQRYLECRSADGSIFLSIFFVPRVGLGVHLPHTRRPTVNAGHSSLWPAVAQRLRVLWIWYQKESKGKGRDGAQVERQSSLVRCGLLRKSKFSEGRLVDGGVFSRIPFSFSLDIFWGPL